jgi:hypothetical protein
MHWARWHRHGDPLVTKSRWDGHERKLNTCIVPGCENQQYKTKMCGMHRQRLHRYEDPNIIKPHKRMYEFREQLLDTWTPESAYFLGWVLTDGYIYSRSVGHDSSTVVFDLKDREVTELLCKILEHPKEPQYTSRGYWKLRASSVHLVKRLEELGIGSAKSLTVPLPPVFDEVFSHFVRAVVEGDGSLTAPPHFFRAAINSASREFLSALEQKLPFKGSLFQVGKRKRKNPLWRLVYSGKEALRFCEWIYQDSDGMYLSRKYERYLVAREAA